MKPKYIPNQNVHFQQWSQQQPYKYISTSPIPKIQTTWYLATKFYHMQPQLHPTKSSSNTSKQTSSSISGMSFLGIWGWATAWWCLVGAGAAECKGSFFSFGTAGNDPLLLVLGRAIMGSAAEAPVAGAAARILDCSASLRCTLLSRLCDSKEPPVLKSLSVN